MIVNLNSESLSLTEVHLRPELGVIVLSSNYKDFFKKNFSKKKSKKENAMIHIIIFIVIKMLILI